MSNENMKLWDSVCQTDPNITKKVNQRGGFTAIDAQAQIKRATELWGPYGKEWGVKRCKYDILSEDKNGGNFGNPIGMMLEADFYYPNGEFEIATDMPYKPNGDCCKKLLTDLTTKALSKLGFNSDIFEGKGPLGFKDNIGEELETIDQDRIDEIEELRKKAGIGQVEFQTRLKDRYEGINDVKELYKDSADGLIRSLKKTMQLKGEQEVA